MVRGDDIIYKCPDCGTYFKQMNIFSGNNLGAEYYSDGKCIAPMNPDLPIFTKCKRCGAILRIKGLSDCTENVDSFVRKGILTEKDVRDGIPYCEHLDIEDLYKALQLFPNSERDIRVKIWWKYNDAARTQLQNGLTDLRICSQYLDKKEYKENCYALLNLLDINDWQQRCMIRELYRNLGEFEKALEIGKDDTMCNITLMLHDECKKRNRFLFRTDNYIFDYMKDENYAFNNTESLPRNEGNIDSSESQKPLFKKCPNGHYYQGAECPYCHYPIEERPSLNCPDTFEIDGGNFEIIRHLGTGGYGIAYLANMTISFDSNESFNYQNSSRVVLKELFYKKYCYRIKDTLRIEFDDFFSSLFVKRLTARMINIYKALMPLDCCSLAKTYGYFLANNTVYQIMEYVSGCSLFDKVMYNGPLLFNEAKTYMRDVAIAVAVLHRYNILHLDIKPQNIIIRSRNTSAVSSDKSYSYYQSDLTRPDMKYVPDHACLIDFNTCRFCDEKNDTEYLGYSAGFTSKEVYDKNVNDISVYSDIYSLGAILYYAITGSMLTLDKESYEIDASLLNSSVKQFLKKAVCKQFDIHAFIKELDDCEDFNFEDANLVIDNFDKINEFNLGYAVFLKNGKYGIVNDKKQVVVPPIYDKLMDKVAYSPGINVPGPPLAEEKWNIISIDYVRNSEKGVLELRTNGFVEINIATKVCFWWS